VHSQDRYDPRSTLLPIALKDLFRALSNHVRPCGDVGNGEQRSPIIDAD
jgi:hypothetical protein